MFRKFEQLGHPLPVTAIAVSSMVLAAVALWGNFLSGAVAVGMLVIGLSGSYYLGRESRKAPPVRQSFRHLARVQANLLALIERLADDRSALKSYQHTPQEGMRRAGDALSMAEFVLWQTFGYVGEAMEDWADLAPEEVEELRRELRATSPEVADETDAGTVATEGWEAAEWVEIEPSDE